MQEKYFVNVYSNLNWLPLNLSFYNGLSLFVHFTLEKKSFMYWVTIVIIITTWVTSLGNNKKKEQNLRYQFPGCSTDTNAHKQSQYL